MKEETPTKLEETKTDREDTDKNITEETRTDQEETGIKQNAIRLHQKEVAIKKEVAFQVSNKMSQE